MLPTQEDPVLISARREALIVFASWLIAMTWSVSYCYLNGYISLIPGVSTKERQTLSKADLKAEEKKRSLINGDRLANKQHVEVRPAATSEGVPELWVDRGNGPERVSFFLGFPSWVFWGVALPWWICTAFSLIFGAFLVRDEDLGLDPEQAAEAAEGAAHA